MSDEERKVIEELKNKKADYFMISNLTCKTILNLIEKQSKEIEEYKKQLDLDNECEIALNSKVMDLEKEIEELKEDKYGLEEEVQIQAKQLIEIDGNYISKEESEQKEKKAYIDGTNIADELCNKKWIDKIKSKIDEVCESTIEESNVDILYSLLEKE